MKDQASIYKWLAIGGLAGVVLLFTHCGKPFSEKGDLMWEQNGVTVPIVGTSGASSLDAFQATVYPITRARCASCHASTQQPLHASANVTTAHNAVLNSYKVDFSNIPNSRMVRKLQEGHNCWGSCTANATEMQLAIEDWKDLMQNAGGGGAPAPSAIPPVVTRLTSTSRTVTQERASANAPMGPFTLRFPLTSLGVAGGTVEFRLEDYDMYSYRITQLRIISPNRSVVVKGVYVIMNGKFNPQNANLTQVDQTVAQSAAGTVLTPSSMILLKDLGGDDTFALGFETLQ